MPYSEEDMAEIEKDPARLRAYYWRMAQHWRLNYPNLRWVADQIIEELDAIVASHFPADNRS